jgi:hypothetical protein
MSRTERLREMHERRRLWTPVPRCVQCRRTLSAVVLDGVAPCERCLTVSGEMVPDSTPVVTAAFRAAVHDADGLARETRACPSIWDARLRPVPVQALLVSSAARGRRGWSVLRLTPSFGADVELFALAATAIGEAVRVVLADVASTARVSDVRTGRTLVVSAA